MAIIPHQGVFNNTDNTVSTTTSIMAIHATSFDSLSFTIIYIKLFQNNKFKYVFEYLIELDCEHIPKIFVYLANFNPYIFPFSSRVRRA